METKQKKSFIDRLMGGGKKENDEKNNLESSRKKGENIEEVIASQESELALEPGGEEQKVNDFAGKEEKKEDWLNKENEEEGQLAVDVYQSGDFIIIKSIIGGVRPEDLDISATNDMVIIKGKRKNPENVNPDNCYYQECFWGAFSRSIILPCDIKSEQVEATMKNGVLTIRLPKIEKDSSSKIKVKEE